MSDDDKVLHTKYRPRTFDEVVGHNVIKVQLDKIIEKGSSRAFVFGGPSGTGKTTLARIVAKVAGCARENIIEIDAATNTGVDAMRAVAEAINYRPFGGGSKAVIIDEAHGLSKQAWDSLLKVVEEPPKHAYWFFCTTNAPKLPTTLKTRCSWFMLNLLSEKDIKDLVDDVADREKMNLNEGVLDLIAREAHGSPRQALSNLATCDGVKDRKVAAKLLHTALEGDAVIELCRFLFKGGSWMKAMAIVDKLEGENPEGVRIVVVNYYQKVAKGATSRDSACHALSILEAFGQPYNQAEGLAPLFLSLGRVLFP